VKITYEPIGVIHSPFSDLDSMPIQPTSESSGPGRIEIDTPFVPGLKDLEGFSHIILLYHLHQVRNSSLTVIPFLDSVSRGVFATRAPTRPNPIGLSVVRLVQIEGATLHVEDLDVLDGTPLLDIKPYIPEVDHRAETRTGWLERVKEGFSKKVSDDRFR
jgi:tRNA-Thr(GGU) m(6)t(6)A37 methyltransferase TsaA